MLSIGFKTDKGKLRNGNEDSLFVFPDQNLYIVADGVGGHNSGEIASRIAVAFMAQYVALNPLSSVEDDEVLQDYFKTCFEGANDIILKAASEEYDYTGMATTAVLCCVKDDWAYIVNVGDSRAYLIRDGIERQITVDHTYVNALLSSGMLSEAEAAVHPDRNMITRALGAEESVEPDYYRFPVYSGDIIILCTDGLYGELPEGSLSSAADKSENMHDMAGSLVNQANEHGGRDNISVICIKVL